MSGLPHRNNPLGASYVCRQDCQSGALTLSYQGTSCPRRRARVGTPHTLSRPTRRQHSQETDQLEGVKAKLIWLFQLLKRPPRVQHRPVCKEGTGLYVPPASFYILSQIPQNDQIRVRILQINEFVCVDYRYKSQPLTCFRHCQSTLGDSVTATGVAVACVLVSHRLAHISTCFASRCEVQAARIFCDIPFARGIQA